MSEQNPKNIERPFINIEQISEIKSHQTENARKAFMQNLFGLFEQGVTPQTITNEQIAAALGVKNSTITISNKLQTLCRMGRREALPHFYKRYQENKQQT
jgi:hypothetical protein